jgi:hypothetical protein
MAKKEIVKAGDKHPGGAPSLYKEEFCQQALVMTRLGATDQDLADCFGVCVRTIAYWKNEKEEFLQAIKKGKDEFDTERVEGALRHRALGYDYPEEKIFCKNGKVTRAKTVKHCPPDTAALIFWLKNRDPGRWRDKQEIDHTTKGESLNNAASPEQLTKAKKSIIERIRGD